MSDTCNMDEKMIEKIGSVEQLDAIRQNLCPKDNGERVTETEKILICMGGGCIASGSVGVRDALTESLEKHDLTEKVSVVETGCLGPCVRGPVVMVGTDRVYYQNLKPADAEKIVEQHVVGQKVVEELNWADGSEDDTKKTPVPLQDDIEFFKRQTKIVLRNCGLIDPGSITDYIARDGYRALGKVLGGMTREEVLGEMNASGLRGRGGGGFPTGRKWEFAAKSADETKYILCNADEGDPGAFMDRSVLEGDPHSVIEGMLIGAYTIGASQGYVYVRAEYPLAVERLNKAIHDARAAGLLGENILGSGFSCDLEIRMGSGAFVCGEETALIASIEGQRGEPRSRPPFPAVKGLWEKPSLLNNVETYANVPAILLNGGDWFASFGEGDSHGTKVFALAGAINISGLVEVPVGTTLREIIYDIGGGIPGGKEFKAAQIGGPSGGCIPTQYLDVPIDYESLNELGAIMGSGGLVVMDESTCMVDVARFFIEFMEEESCGKCVPCRVGISRMLDILNKICSGQGADGDLEELERVGEGIKNGALCGLGQTAPNPVLSTIRHFRDEYEAHINDKHCPAGVCKSLLTYTIDAEKCTGCTLCAKKCPTDAIEGTKKNPHRIIKDKCIACGACLEVCPFDAVILK